MRRREFLQNVSATAVAAQAAASTFLVGCSTQRAASKDLVNGKINVCCAGIKGRGNSLFHEFGKCDDVIVKYACDVDSEVLDRRTGEFTSAHGATPEKIKDFRRALDDKDCDAIVLGTPDHWHAIPTILACQAKKDVYVEKPDGHNLVEGQVMTAAAKKHGRVIQLGTQARSCPDLLALVDYVKQGHLGRVVMAKAWESSRQKDLGKPADTEAPATVDYDFWLGAAPKRPFNPLRFHGNWRWFFDYGAGDLANDGVHRLDQARWFLEVAVEASGEKPLGMPRSVSASGGKYYFDDAQEWPDTLMVTYDYPGRLLTYEMRIWAPYPIDGEPEGAAIFGDKGSLIIGGGRWRHLGPKGEVVKEGTRAKSGADAAHVRNFLDCMRSREKPNADEETVGRLSSLLCHMGNVAWRVGRTVKFDYDAYKFTDDEANQFRTRAEYRAPWTLPKPEDV
jgi:predicted dehydrogenase